MYKRFIKNELKKWLNIMPVVLLSGARQTGKTTLTEMLRRDDGFTYVTFDDENTLMSAKNDPSGWLNSLPKPLIIDEVQRVPELFLSVKYDVDKNREPGRYLLTGSANPLLLPRLGDSLAGRMGTLSLYPFSQGELIEHHGHYIEAIFNNNSSLELKNKSSLSKSELISLLLKGGFPPVQPFQSLDDVNRWVRSYLQTMMERDVREIANIEGIRELPRLFRLLATRTANLLNIADLARSLGMSHMTVKRYLLLLETLYFISPLPPWFSHLGKRITKSPKIHLCDTGILSQVLELNEKKLENDPFLMGQLLENFVFTELQKLKSWSTIPFELYHFRDGGSEVDFVLERPDGSIIGIEVKSSRSFNKDDLKGLKHLHSLTKKKFLRGIVLHLGERIEKIDDYFEAMPIQALWEI